MGYDCDASFEDRLDEWIAYIEKYIENATGRVFIADTSASAKVFDGENTKEFYIPECVEITKVEVDDDDDGVFEEIVAADYFKYPANETPYTRIKISDLSDDYFSEGEQNVKITAKWGYSVACPYDIQFAAMILVAGIINSYNVVDDNANVKSESIGNYSVSYGDRAGWQDFKRAQEILRSYKKLIFA